MKFSYLIYYSFSTIFQNRILACKQYNNNEKEEKIRVLFFHEMEVL